MEKKKIILLIVTLLLTLFLIGSFGTFSYYLIILNIIPTKYLIFGFGIIFILFVTLFYFVYSKNKRISKVIAMIFMFIISIFSFLGIKYLMTTYDFFRGTQKDYDTLTYSVVVLENSSYNKLKDLSDKTISYLSDNYERDIKSYLDSKISYNEKLASDFTTLSNSLLNSELDAIVLEESYLILIKEEIKEFANNTKVIDTFEVNVKTYKEEVEENVDILNPFVLYISGIDQYGNVNSVRGRSDVNQILLVNPKTHHILIVNTPRDYYVQLAGTTGLKDKLTHAGIYGIDKSVKTLENLYDIDINYYLRVNFNTVIKVVDVIGGIDIYSDKAFRALTNKNVYVTEGWNHFNGKEALAYSRERYAYITGDHHRGANQQQVITAIIDKLTSSSVLISKYNSILNVLDGSFQTDMSTGMITSFIKYQLDEMPTWTVDSYAVSGYNSYNYTYSMGTNYKLYVMEPNMETVNIAKQKMQEVLNES